LEEITVNVRVMMWIQDGSKLFRDTSTLRGFYLMGRSIATRRDDAASVSINNLAQDRHRQKD
jgi:hypothetical protein